MNNRLYVISFIIGSISIGGEGRGTGPPGYVYGLMITVPVCSHTNNKIRKTNLLKNIYRNRNTKL